MAAVNGQQQIITCPVPDMSHVEKFGFLFGYPIAHSLSPMFHKAVYQNLGLSWEQFFLESTDIPQFLELTRQPQFFGAAVTMPHKVAIIPHLDDLTEEGRDVGAVNTVFIKHEGGQRKLVGTNTDVIGIRGSFVENVSNPEAVYEGRPGLVVGGGGAARSAVYALKKFLKAGAVYLVNRDKAEVDAVIGWCKDHGYGDDLIHVATAEQARSLEGVGAIVACVPDFPPVTSAEIEARAVFETFLNKPHRGAILEMCYHPKTWTQIAQLSQDAKWQVILGTEAMIYQGFAQDTFWTGKGLPDLPVEEVKKVIHDHLAKTGH